MKVTHPLVKETQDGVVWVESGHTFTFDDLVYFRGKGETDFEAIAGGIDLILTGPHASGALPRELEPFLVEGIDERTQFDFSDHTTGPLARAWAEADPRVVYIEFPHHRLMFDPNRAPSDDIEGNLRTFFERWRAEQAGREVSYNGIDAVRPVSFGGVQFLREPRSESEWGRLVAAVHAAAQQGAGPYDRVKSKVIETVFAAKSRRLHDMDRDTVTLPDFYSSTRLHLNCVHDTMQTTIGPDGAVNQAKPPDSTLPDIVSLGNRGDWRGEPRPTADGSLMSPVDTPTIEGRDMRAVQRALQLAFGVPDEQVQDALALNRPYLGAYEVQEMGRRLRALEESATVRHRSGEGVVQIRTGAYQSEFQRELLLGPTNTRIVTTPGSHWPDPDIDHVGELAAKLASSYEILRRWDFELAPTSSYEPPKFR